MKVRELISLLSQQPQDSDITIRCDNHIEDDYVNQVIGVKVTDLVDMDDRPVICILRDD